MTTKGTFFRRYKGYSLGTGPIMRKRMLRIFVVAVVVLYGLSLMNFLRADAGLGEIEHYSARRTTDFTTTSTSWTGITGGSADTGTTVGTNGWIDSTNFTVGEDYLILVTGAHTSDASSRYTGMRVKHGSTAFTESEDYLGADGHTDTTRRKHFSWFTVWTAVSGEDLTVELITTSGTGYAGDITMLAINAENLVADGDLQYDIDTTGGTLTTSYVSKVGLSWTPSNNNDTWWIYSYAKVDAAITGQRHLGRLDVNGTVRGSFDNYEKDANNTYLQNLGWAQQFTNSAKTVDLELAESAADTEWDAAGVFALNLDVFEAYDISTGAGPTSMPANDTFSEIAAVAPNVQTVSDVYIYGNASQDESTSGVCPTRAQINTRIQDSGTNVTDVTGAYQLDNCDVFTHSVAEVIINESTGVQDYDMDSAGTASGSGNSQAGTGETDSRYMIAFSMELAGTPTAGPSVIDQKAYIWENDDEDQSTGDSVDENAQLAAGNTALTNVTKGERLTLRTLLENDGSAHNTSDLSLFYDRNDGYFTKVQSYAAPETAAGTGCADSKWTCEIVDNGINTGRYSSVAINPITNTPWIAYFSFASYDLYLAEYVGSGGTGCSNSAWTCELVESTAAAGSFTNIAFTESGVPYIAYIDASGDDVWIAEYVGTGGTGCNSARWTCTEIIDATNLLSHTALAIDQNGDPWVSFRDDSANDLYVAEYVGSGGDCDTLQLSGSDAWECTAIETTDAVNGYTSIAFDDDNVPWISYQAGSSDLYVAELVGTGGTGCNDTAWTCTAVWATGAVGDGSSIAFAPDGNAWVSFGDTGNDLNVANYVGTGGNCDNNQGGSDAWDCTEVDNVDGDDTYTSLAFAPDGNAWVSYFESGGGVQMARFVGSGGSGCTSTAWECIEVLGTVNVGQWLDMAIDNTGNAIISFHDNVAYDLEIAHVDRGGEIITSPGIAGEAGDALSESHSDMTSVTDTLNRDSADCISGTSSWNNGKWTDNQVVRDFSLPDGGTTTQCSEVAWTIDTSQAQEGETYRFVVASDDDFNISDGKFRGPSNITQYPTITIEAAADYNQRYSKASYPRWPDCDDSTDFGCDDFRLAGNIQLGQNNDITFTPDGTAWMMAATNTGSDDIYAMEYVGSGGTGCSVSDWNCTLVWDTTDDTGGGGDIASGSDGSVWMTFFDDTDDSLWVAHRVGSGGSCVSYGGSAEWDCYKVDNSANTGWQPKIAVKPDGLAAVTYREYFGSGVAGDLRYAEFVGSGGNCTDSAWECYQVEDLPDTSNEVGSDIAFDSTGKGYIVYEDDSVGALMIAEYVGAGGTGCDTPIWNCYAISNDASAYAEITIDGDDDPHIAARLSVSGSKLWHMEYVGSGGNCDSTGTGGSDAWQCTNVENSINAIGNRIAVDAEGYVWIAFWDYSNADMWYATTYPHVGNACDGTGWRCALIDNNNNSGGSQGQYRGLAIGPNGDPWISYHNWQDLNLHVAKLHEPNVKPNVDQYVAVEGIGGRTGDAQYRLTDGRSPHSDNYDECNTRSLDLGYCGVAREDGLYDRVEATANEDALFVFAEKFDTNTDAPSARWIGQSTVAPSASGEGGDIVLEVYRFGTTNQWETLGLNKSAIDCDGVDCYVGGVAQGTASQYYEADGSDYWAFYRVRQIADGSTTMTFKTDTFQAGIGAAPLLTQKAYIWENDDEDQASGDAVDENTQLAAGDTALTNVRRGQRLTVRFQIENNGMDFDDDLGLFYSSNDDDIWTRVEDSAPLKTPIESGCSSVSYLSCESIVTTDNVGNDNFVAIHPGTGLPWLVYDNETNNDASVAYYVGQGGTGCVTDEWQCDVIAATGVTGEDTSIAFAPDGTAWVSFYDEDSDDLMVAEFVGANGDCDTTEGGSDAWECTAVVTSGNVGLYSEITVDKNGTPWITYADETNFDMEIARYVGSGGSGCASSAWTCFVLDNTTADMTSQTTSIEFDHSNTPWVTYTDVTNQTQRIARYVGGGGSGCASGITDWSCENLFAVNDNNPNGKLFIAPDGNPWIRGRLNNNGSSTNASWIAKYVGAGGNCDTKGGSDAWQCDDIDDPTNIVSSPYGSLGFDPVGTPWTIFNEQTAQITKLAREVGSGGTGCSNAAWNCETLLTGQTTSNIAPSISFNDLGHIEAYSQRVTNDIGRVSTDRRGAFTIANGASGSTGDPLQETHTDMTSSTNTANRDDADCETAGAVFVDGVWSDSSQAPVALPGATNSVHCTEVAFTIDTTNAELAETYQFILASKDSANPSNYIWRAMNVIDNYATLTINDVDTTQIAKGYTYNTDSDCDLDSDWTCQKIHDGAYDTFGSFLDIGHGVDGSTWVAFSDTTDDTLNIAEYVGDSSGTGCTVSNDWSCYVVDGTGSEVVGNYVSIDVDSFGVPHIAYQKDSNVWYARYVGSSGGSGCTSSDWDCVEIRDTAQILGAYLSIAVSEDGETVWIPHQLDGTYNDQTIATNRGGGEPCVGGTDGWSCYQLDDSGTDTGRFSDIALDNEQMPWIKYQDLGSTETLVAHFVGSGGTGCNNGSEAWVCYVIDNTTSSGAFGGIAIDKDGVPWITYRHNTEGDSHAAKFVGSGGNCDSTRSGSDAWECYEVAVSNGNTSHETVSIGPSGYPVMSMMDPVTDTIWYAEYVGSGGNCDTVAAGSDAWNCLDITTNTTIDQQSKMSVDAQGVVWIVYEANDDLYIAKQKQSSGPLSAITGLKYSHNGALSSSGLFQVDPGNILIDGTPPTCKNNTNGGYCGVFGLDSVADTVTAPHSADPYFTAKIRVDSNSAVPGVGWTGASSLAPSTAGASGNLELEIFRFGTTNAWESLATDTASTDCTIKCTLSGNPSGTPSEYYETDGGGYWMHVRVVQRGSITATTDLKTDAFIAISNEDFLRHGQAFVEEAKVPFTW